MSRVLDIAPRYEHSGDTLWVRSGICKTLKTQMFTGVYERPGISVKKPPLFTVSGNVQYDYLYRSFADTPYFQKDFRQHTIQTSLAISVRNNYPFHLRFIIRKSNSPYFRDFFDGGFLFDRHTYYRNMKNQLLEKVSNQLPEFSYLKAAEVLLKKELTKFNLLKEKLSRPNLAQQIIEAREKKYFDSLKSLSTGIPVVKKPGEVDSLVDHIEDIVLKKKAELDSLKQVIDRVQGKVDSLKNKLSSAIGLARQKLKNVNSSAAMKGWMQQYGIVQERKGFDEFITNLKSINIGRTMLNYSDLTARNVSLTGVNVEYNPRMYMAFAAGKIDYGFRDFFGKNTRRAGQYIVMGRLGIGDIEKRALIFSLFTGRKTNYTAVLSDTVNGNIQLTGYSIEAILKKDARNFLSAEIAKSTRPLTGRFGDNKELSSLFRLSDQSNLGISLNGQGVIVQTQTEISAMFRKTGENFQSFSLFSYNTDQTAWHIKLDQPFFNKKATFSGMIRKNDFVNPFTEKTFKTSTVFGSVQLAVRIPKLPAFTVGYYPGSQLYIVDRDKVRENVYYVLNGTIMYPYKIGRSRWLTSAIYNQYTNKGTDSGFINYNGRHYMFSQALYAGKLEYQGSLIYTDQQEFKFYSAEGNLAFTPSPRMRLGGGLKYNKVISGEIYWGGTGQLMIDMNRLGNLQLQYEKSFLPTIQQTLFPVESGRLTWFKTF